MDIGSQRPMPRDATLSLLNAAVKAVNLAKELSSVTPVKAVFGTVSLILTMIRVSPLLVFGEQLKDEVDLGYDGQ